LEWREGFERKWSRGVIKAMQATKQPGYNKGVFLETHLLVNASFDESQNKWRQEISNVTPKAKNSFRKQSVSIV